MLENIPKNELKKKKYSLESIANVSLECLKEDSIILIYLTGKKSFYINSGLLHNIIIFFPKQR